MLGVFLLVITISFPLIMTFIPFRYDLLYPNKKSLTTAGVWFIIFGLCAVVAGVWLGVENGNDVKELKNGQDSLEADVKSISKKYDIHAKSDSLIGLAFDPKTNKLIIIDSQLLRSLLITPSQNEKPKLDLFYSSNIVNPIIRRTERMDSVIFEVALIAIGNLIADSPRDKIVFINKRNNLFSFPLKMDTRPTLNKYNFLTSAKYVTLYRYLTSSDGFQFPSNDTCYIYLKISYTNQAGKIQEPFRQIFLFTNDKIGVEVPFAPPQEVEKITKFLEEKNLW